MLKPCPKCRSTDVRFGGYSRSAYSVICEDCCIQTKFYPSRDAAAKAWNIRAAFNGEGAAKRISASSHPASAGDEALTFIDKFFEPWGSWKTVWWESEVSGDAAFSADNALKHVANILRRALSATPAQVSDAKTAPEVLALAQEIVKQHYPEMPAHYTGRRVQIAIAAIMEVTDRAAIFMQKFGSADSIGSYDDATALRNMEHLK